MTIGGRLARGAAIVVLVAAHALAVGIGPSAATAPEWNVDRVGGPASGAGTVIAVVDTGVDGDHPALAGRVRPPIDVVGAGAGDDSGHGTHVAGIAAGADAGCGAIGVAPDAEILPVRVLDEEGTGTVEQVSEGIRRAADAGATVINLSLGTDVVLRAVSGSGLVDAIRYAWERGSIPVLAAGNDGLFGGLLGSGYDGVPAVVVTATDHRDRVAAYATSIGSADWGVAAPGGDTSGEDGRDILSAFPDRRCALHAGTSMAAPHVAGVLAELRSHGASPTGAVEVLLATAVDLGGRGHDGTYGHGLVDLRAALAALRGPVPSTTDIAAPSASVAAAPSAAEVPDPTSTTGPRPDVTEPVALIEGGIEDAPPSPVAVEAPEASPSPPASRSVDPAREESAPPFVVTDVADDGDPPGSLVAAATIVLAATAAGTALAARRLPRRGSGVGFVDQP